MPYNNLNYAHAIGRIRVLETKLLQSTDVERMLGARNAEDAYKVLNDLDYANHIGDIDNIESFQKVLNSGLHEVKELLTKIAPYNEVLDLLWFQYDFHNIRTLIRAKVHPVDESELESNYLVNIGSYSHNLLQKFIFEGAYASKIDDELKSIINAGLKLYTETDDSYQLDLFLDQSYFKKILKMSKLVKNDFVETYLRMSIDIVNIKMLLRLINWDNSSLNYNDIFLLGGFIPKDKLVALKNKSLDEVVEILKFSGYHDLLKKGVSAFKKENSFLLLEKLLDNKIMYHMKKAKKIAFGPEPLFAYFWAKMNNAQLIRTIMIGKMNDVDEIVIRDRLRELYV